MREIALYHVGLLVLCGLVCVRYLGLERHTAHQNKFPEYGNNVITYVFESLLAISSKAVHCSLDFAIDNIYETLMT